MVQDQVSALKPDLPLNIFTYILNNERERPFNF